MYQLKNKAIRPHRSGVVLIMSILLSSLALGMETQQGNIQLPEQVDRVDDLIAVAMENNPEIKALHAAWMGRNESVLTVVTLPDPTLAVGYFLEPVETAQGPQRLKLSLGQTIPWLSSAKSEKQVSQARAAQALEKLKTAQLNLKRELRTQWAEAGFLNQAMRLIEQKVALSKDLEQVLKIQYKSASISHRSLLDVQIQTLELIEKQMSLEDQLYRVRVNLGTAMGLNMPLAEESLPDRAGEKIEEILNGGVSSSHPRLVQIDGLKQESLALRSVAQANFIPDLRVGLDYILTDEKSLNGSPVANSGKDPLAISVGFALPLWNWKQKRSSVESAKWMEKRADALEQHETLILAQEYERSSSKLSELRRQAALYTDELIPRQQEIVDVLEQSYISQRADIQAFTQARQQLLDLQLKYAETLRSIGVQTANLTYLKGE